MRRRFSLTAKPPGAPPPHEESGEAGRHERSEYVSRWRCWERNYRRRRRTIERDRVADDDRVQTDQGLWLLLLLCRRLSRKKRKKDYERQPIFHPCSIPCLRTFLFLTPPPHLPLPRASASPRFARHNYDKNESERREMGEGEKDQSTIQHCTKTTL